MNANESEVLKVIKKYGFESQRVISMKTGLSLGNVNIIVNKLKDDGLFSNDNRLTEKAESIFEESKPRSAIILAAGYGMRMVPINLESPKGLLKINDETLIERIIKQLHEVHIQDIYVVVGFLKENYEFLIDEYNVKLICNSDYSIKNNLHSLYLAKEYLSNSYIIPCDIWCKNNLFNTEELNSWYMVSNEANEKSDVIVNKKKEIIRNKRNSPKNRMVGISYVNKTDSEMLVYRLSQFEADKDFDSCFWEEAAFINNKMIFNARIIDNNDVTEIDTYEQLREFSPGNALLKSAALDTIGEALGVKTDLIKDITVMKKGMTNRSFIFSCNGSRYIMRIPGEGTDMLIDRRQEYDVYEVLKGKDICDHNVYLNPENGYKITKFIENSRVCDPLCQEDLEKCMKKLVSFHNLHLKVNHSFEIFKLIDFYESLWNGKPSVYRDYKTTKENVLSLQAFISSQKKELSLTHIDAVPDNFLIYKDFDGNDKISLIDWEYAGMQDPHVDIAMFCIYALYDKAHIDNLIETYFRVSGKKLDEDTRTKIYCYVAACGLLWSNWCEYKSMLGVEFGEYSLIQYRYAKDFYKIVKERIDGSAVNPE